MSLLITCHFKHTQVELLTFLQHLNSAHLLTVIASHQFLEVHGAAVVDFPHVVQPNKGHKTNTAYSGPNNEAVERKVSKIK